MSERGELPVELGLQARPLRAPGIVPGSHLAAAPDLPQAEQLARMAASRGATAVPAIDLPRPILNLGAAPRRAKTLEITWQGKNIADVLGLTVDLACELFADEPAVRRPLPMRARRHMGLAARALSASRSCSQATMLADAWSKKRGRPLPGLRPPCTHLA